MDDPQMPRAPNTSTNRSTTEATKAQGDRIVSPMVPSPLQLKSKIRRFGFGGLCFLVGLIVFAYQEYQSQVGQAPSWSAGLAWLAIVVILFILGIWMWDRTAKAHWLIRLSASFLVSGLASFLGYGPIQHQYRVEHLVSKDVLTSNHNVILHPNDLIVSWGIAAPDLCKTTISTDELLPFKDDFHLLVAIRPQDNTIDAMQDSQILKSPTFSIRGGELPIEIRMPQQFLAKAFVVRSIGNGMYEHKATIEFWLILLPIRFGSEQIATLSDVEKLGGRVIAGKAVGPIPISK